MEPALGCERLDASTERAADERIADLRSEGDHGASGESCAVFAQREGVVRDERAEAVGEDQVGIVAGDVLQQARAGFSPQTLVLDPLDDHPGGPANALREALENPAPAAEDAADALADLLSEIAHAVDDATLKELGERFRDARPGDRIPGEDVVVRGEVELELAGRTPGAHRRPDRLAPLVLPRYVGVVVSDSMNAQHPQGRRHRLPPQNSRSIAGGRSARCADLSAIRSVMQRSGPSAPPAARDRSRTGLLPRTR